MRAAVNTIAKPRLEFHWLKDPVFLIDGFPTQCHHRMTPLLTGWGCSIQGEAPATRPAHPAYRGRQAPS
eukprot:5354650-Pyramimonas_sp.AAC.1